MRSLDPLPVDVAVDSSERQDSTSSGSTSSNNGGIIHSGLGEAKHLRERLNTAQVKVKRLQRLEAALVDFFMEVMDRSENNGPDSAAKSIDTESSFARNKRKEQFLKKAEGDPISLLNALRTHLRLQFAEQEAQQAAAERQALAEDLINQHKEQNAQEQFQQLQLTCKQLTEQQNSLRHQLDQQDVDQTRTRCQYETLVEELKVQVQDERSREQTAQLLVTKQQQEIATLQEIRHTLIKAAQSHKNLDGARTPRATTGDLPDANSNNSSAGLAASASGPGTSDFFGTPAENQTLRRALRKYEIKVAQTEAANDEHKREVQRLQQQLTGLRRSTQFQMYSRLEKKSRQVHELADELKRQLTESEADLLRTKGTLKERDIQVQKMRDEYARLFTAIQKQKQPAHYSPSKLSRASSTLQLSTPLQPHALQLPLRLSGAGTTEALDNAVSATPANGEHPYVVEYYRSEAARVERESEALKLQIRRMMASEQLHKQKTRVMQAETQKLTLEREQLRADLDRAKKHNTLQSIAMHQQKPRHLAETRKRGLRTTCEEVKQLQERNVFLEERFRKSLQNNAAIATVGAVARLRSSVSVPSRIGGPDPVGDSEAGGAEIPRQNSTILTTSRPASAHAVTLNKECGGSFWSLDAATLQSLQQVKRATRIQRPQSAIPIK